MDFTLVYMAAGLSLRFGGKAKGLAKVGPNNESLLEYSLNQALLAGFNKIILIVSEKTKPLFEKEFGDNYKKIPILYSIQKTNLEKRDKPWGTTDAICSAKNIIDSNFVVCNGDDIYGKEIFQILANHFKTKNNCATIGYKLEKVVPEKGAVNRGIFKTDRKNQVRGIKETFNLEKSNLPLGITSESLCSMNVFALTPKALNELDEILKKFKETNEENRKIECLLPKELESLIKQKKITMNLYLTDSKWFGITNPEDEIKIRNELKNKI